MAERRMFTKKIVDSDSFLDMPMATQALYFHLNMRADDDGFVNNPKMIQRMIGASEDDLKLLIAKRFIIAFENGVIVIKHWRMHNLLRKDRYTPTQYKDQMALIELKDNGSYTERYPEPLEKVDSESLATIWQPFGDQMATQYSIDKESIDKDSSDEEKKPEEKKPSEKKKKDPIVYFPEDELLDKAFNDYLEMRRQIKKPATERAIQLAISKLQDLSRLPFSDSMDNDRAIEILNQSVLNNWAGLYPLKGNAQDKGKGGIDWSKV